MTVPLTPRRRWLRYSMRTLFVVMTLSGIWLGWNANRAHRQRAAVERVLELGGSVEYDFHVISESAFGYDSDLDAISPYPAWLIRLTGVDFWHRLVTVKLARSKADNDDLRLLGRVPSIEYLLLGETRVDNDGLQHLKQLPSLRTLGLWNIDVDDRGLEQLACHKRLRMLSLQETNVADDGLAYLEGMTELEWLILIDTRVSDAGLVHLQGLKKLQYLDLRGTQVTPAGLEKLRLALPKTQFEP